MDAWGPDEASKPERIAEVVAVMRAEAEARGLPFIDLAGRLLVRRAIQNARRNACQSCHPSGMGRAKPQPKPEAVILPPDLDDDDEHAGGGIPDDDGWVHLDATKRKEAQREDETPKRRRTSRRRA
jgi:hypothetical protein